MREKCCQAWSPYIEACVSNVNLESPQKIMATTEKEKVFNWLIKIRKEGIRIRSEIANAQRNLLSNDRTDMRDTNIRVSCGVIRAKSGDDFQKTANIACGSSTSSPGTGALSVALERGYRKISNLSKKEIERSLRHTILFIIEQHAMQNHCQGNSKQDEWESIVRCFTENTDRVFEEFTTCKTINPNRIRYAIYGSDEDRMDLFKIQLYSDMLPRDGIIYVPVNFIKVSVFYGMDDQHVYHNILAPNYTGVLQAILKHAKPVNDESKFIFTHITRVPY